MDMKKISIIQSLFMTFIFSILFGCTSSFDELNTNPNAAEVVPATNVLARGIIDLSGTLFGERLDIYYAGSYSGHLAAIGLGDYEYRVDINNSMWRSMYLSMTYLVDAARLAQNEGNENLYAAALTLKAYAAHKTSDMWGKMPYTEAFKLESEKIMYPVYDDEPTVYNAILAELKEAADIFKNGTGSLGVGDILFHGDVAAWRKFCNSTRLRVAIRMSSADPTTATAVISEILNDPDSYPVMTDNDDNAYLYFPGVTPDQEYWFERLGTTTGVKTDQYRTNDVLISIMNDYNDPRLPVYADKNKWGVYNGYEFGPDQLSDTTNNGNNVSHIGNRFSNDPKGFSPFMNCAEVSFIKAEIYERGILTGSAQEAYETGITQSLAENGIEPADIATYLAETEVAWNSGVTTNLEKVYMQKWISLFKQSVEAWSEARRTDVPLMTDISKNYAATHNRPPFRMAYADEEKSLNMNFPSTVNEQDIFWGTQLWWDKRTNVH